MKSWEKCPICNGTGKLNETVGSPKCTVCEGKKIISTLTGLPPNNENSNSYLINNLKSK